VKPARFDLVREPLRHIRVRGERLSPPGQGLKPQPAKNHRRNPLWVRGREHGRHEGAISPASNAGPGGSSRVHDGDDVVNLLFQRRHPGHPVGHTRPPLVEHDHPAEAREAIEESRVFRQLPHHLEVRRQAGDRDHVLPGAEDLVGEVDVTRPHEARLRDLGHDFDA